MQPLMTRTRDPHRQPKSLDELIPALRRSENLDASAIRQLREVRSVDNLLTVLSGANASLRNYIVRMFRDLRHEAFASTAIGLLHNDTDDSVRCQSVYFLHDMGSADAVNDLCEAIRHDSSQYVRRAALLAISWLKPAISGPVALSTLLTDPSEYVRTEAIDTLAVVRFRDAIPVLANTVRQTESSEQQNKIVSTMAQIDFEAAVPALFDLVKSDFPNDVRNTALRELFKRGAEDWLPELLLLSAEYSCLDFYSALQKSTSESVIRVARTAADAKQREDALSVLFFGHIRTRRNYVPSPPAQQLVRELAWAAKKDPSPEVRGEAVSLLGMLKGINTTGVASLEAVAKNDADSLIRAEASIALDELGARELRIEPVLDGLRSPRVHAGILDAFRALRRPSNNRRYDVFSQFLIENAMIGRLGRNLIQLMDYEWFRHEYMLEVNDYRGRRGFHALEPLEVIADLLIDDPVKKKHCDVLSQLNRSSPFGLDLNAIESQLEPTFKRAVRDRSLVVSGTRLKMDLDLLDTLPHDLPGPSTTTLQSEVADWEAESLLRHFGERQQSILRMLHYDRMSFDQIAERLGRSRRTIRRDCNSALVHFNSVVSRNY